MIKIISNAQKQKMFVAQGIHQVVKEAPRMRIVEIHKLWRRLLLLDLTLQTGTEMVIG